MKQNALPNQNHVHFLTGWIVKIQRDGYCPMHKHANWELVYHHQNNGQTSLADGSVYHFEPRCMVLYAANQMHDQIARKSGADHCIHMQIPEDMTRQLPLCLVSPPIHDSDLISNCMSLCHTRLPKTGLAQQALDHQASFVLLRFLQNAQVPTKQRISSTQEQTLKARQYITENFRRIQSVQDVANYLNVGYDHLRHQFALHQGMSLNQCLIQARLKRAEQLLEHSPLTCAQIATMTGFANERYFNTCFKTHTGMTPGQYRKQCQAE